MSVVRISEASQNAACNSVVDLLDGGSVAALINIYSGTMPDSPDIAPGGTLLATLTCSDPAFGSAVEGIASLNEVTSGTVGAGINGTAAWARFATSEGSGVFDCNVGLANAALILSVNGTPSVTLTEGSVVAISGGSFTLPSGA